MSYEMIRQLDWAVAEVFAIMLTLTCLPSAENQLPQDPCFTARVDFTGTLTGFCSLQVNESAAITLTSGFIGVPPDRLAPSLFTDTVAELCNMIAGSWKSRLPPPRSFCHLSPPVVSSAGERPREGSLIRLYCFKEHQLILALNLA